MALVIAPQALLVAGCSEDFTDEVHRSLYPAGPDRGLTREAVAAPRLSGAVGADRVLELYSLAGRNRVLGLDPLLGGSRDDGLVPGGGRELGPSTWPRALVAFHHQHHAYNLRGGRYVE